MAQANEWEGDNLWLLLNPKTVPKKDLYYIFPEHSPAGLDRRRREQLSLLAEGIIEMPERLTPYEGPEKEKELVVERRLRAGRAAGKGMVQLAVPEAHVHYHEQLQSALEEHGAVTKARFSEYQMGYKDNDGEAQALDLKGSRFEVSFNVEPKWVPVNRVESVRLRRQEAQKPKDIQTCMVFPDVQIPFESPEALEVALAVMMDVRPDRIVFLGDLLDLSAWSKYVQQPEFAGATQDAIIKAHQLLASIRKALPKAQIQVLSGNHEARLENLLLQNAKEAYGLKRADQLDGWPVMSVPYLCAFDQLDIEYVPGYPANRVWLNKNLQIRHGTRSQKKGGAVRANTAAEKVSTITGHDHRLSMHASTINTYEGGQQLFSYGAGSLCRLDGHVPSVWQGRDLDGQPVQQYEDWQNGFVLAHYDTENFHVEQVPITLDYKAMFRGKIYQPKPGAEELSYA